MPNNDRPMKRCYVRMFHKELGELTSDCGQDLDEARRIRNNVNNGFYSRFESADVVKVYAKEVSEGDAGQEIDLMDGFEPDDLEKLHPGVTEAIKRLNKRVGLDPSELYAAWDVERVNGALSVSAMQPHYVKGKQKSFWWDGEEFS